jgi:hypothetical protein
VGKGTASTKARHGKVPVMNIDHQPVEVTLQDYYAVITQPHFWVIFQAIV